MKEEISSKDIDFDQLWILNEGHCMRSQVLNICQKRKGGDHNKQFEYNTGSIETLKRMVDLNNGITILPELSLSDLNEEQTSRVRIFSSPVPVREISIVTHRNYLKRGVIKALEDEVLKIIPKHMLQKEKKSVLEAF
jgi:LysR family hydrogen peroxide-inducible transcriptional activator